MSRHIHDETQRKKQVKFRADEHLIDQLDESLDVSRAEFFRECIVEHLDAQDPEPDEIVPDDEELERVYRWIHSHARPYNGALIVNFGEIKSKLANHFDTKKEAVKGRYIRRLRYEGYLGKPQSGRFEVKPLKAEPSPPKHARNTDTGVSADA